MKKLSLMKKISLEECNSRSITDLFFAVLFCYDTKTACVTILLDLGEEYVSVAANGANGKFLDNPKLIIACMEPFGEYYKEGEYRFVMDGEDPVVDLDDLAPAKEFSNKYFNNELST